MAQERFRFFNFLEQIFGMVDNNRVSDYLKY
jgi:hypothetical protein